MTRLQIPSPRRSPSHATANRRDGELEMTPMIDVTFLLLIFFTCTLNFRTLEGHLSAYLPHDSGANETQAEPPSPGIELEVRSGSAGSPTALEYQLEGQLYDSLDALALRLAVLRAEQVAASAAGREVELDAGESVGYGDVIAVVDLVVAAGFEELRFAATLPF